MGGPLRTVTVHSNVFAKYQRRSGIGAGVLRLLAAVVSTGLWMVASSALIILNKNLYSSGFPFPMAATGMGQAFSALGGWAIARAGLMPLRRCPSLLFFATKLSPVIISCAATMFFGNFAYLHLSVAFIQILKAFTPALTLLMCVVAGLEPFSMPLLFSVLLIAIGTGGAVLLESGAPSFALIGFIAFLASSVTEAARVVYSQLLLGPHKFNSAEVLVYVSAPAALLLLGASAVWELPDMLQAGEMIASVTPAAYISAFSMSFIVNVTSYWAIAATSSLTFKVAGCLKNIGVAWYGLVAHGEHLSFEQMAGYAVSMAGFALYSSLKMGGGGKARGKTI